MRNLIVISMVLGIGIGMSNAHVIINDDFNGIAGACPDTAIWIADSNVVLDGSGRVGWVHADGIYTGKQMAAKPAYEVAPSAGTGVRLTITDLQREVWTGEYGDITDIWAGLSVDPTSLVDPYTAIRDLRWGWLVIDMVGPEYPPDFARKVTDIPFDEGDGAWVIEWYTDQIIVYYNGVVKFDSEIAAPTRIVPTDSMTVGIYGVGSWSVDSILLETFEDDRVTDSISRGNQIFLDTGLQVTAISFAPEAGMYNHARWLKSNFTAINWWGAYYPGGRFPDLPVTQKWTRVIGPGDIIATEPWQPWEWSYVPYCYRLQLFDEQDITDQANIDQAKILIERYTSLYPYMLIHTNQFGPQFNTGQIRNFMQQAKPDMLMFDTYPFSGGLDGGSPTIFYRDMQKFRIVGMEGHDGTGMEPIPTGLYLQTCPSTAGHWPTESEIRLNQFASWAFGYKLLEAFIYDKPTHTTSPIVQTVLFTGYGHENPTPQFYYIKETTRQSLNLSDSLVRLQTTGLGMIMGRHDGWLTTHGNTLPAGVSSWNSSMDPYITSISATNIGSRNDGLRGDVIVGYFRPLDPSLVEPGHEDDLYFMLVNGLADENGTASECSQSIVVNFDFAGSDVVGLLRKNRDTGVVEQATLTHNGDLQYSLTTILPGGTGDLYKFDNGSQFVSVVDCIEIVGPVEIDEHAGAQYSCFSYYPDGSAIDVTNSASWSEDSSYAQINTAGYLSTSGVPSGQLCQITVVYNGFYDIHDVIIRNRLSNDECSNAFNMNYGVAYIGSSVDATGFDITSCANSDIADVWHKITAPTTGLYLFSLEGSSFDTSLAVFESCEGVMLACGDDYYDGLESRVIVNLMKDNIYYIRVSGEDGATGEYELIFSLAADINKDGTVDFADLAMQAACWLQEVNSDMDIAPVAGHVQYGDRFVNFADFSELAKNWLWSQ